MEHLARLACATVWAALAVGYTAPLVAAAVYAARTAAANAPW